MPLLDEDELSRLARNPRERIANYAQLVRSHYASASGLYRHLWGDSFHFARGSVAIGATEEPVQHTERWLADEGGFAPGMRVLDVGCGIGGPALTIALHSGVHVTGVDLLDRHIETARARSAEYGLADATTFVLADAMALPFADASFDAVYVFESCCHAPDKSGFIRECTRVLRPGGRFLGTDWLRRAPRGGTDDAALLEPLYAAFVLPSLLDRRALVGQLVSAGLEVIGTESLGSRDLVFPMWGPADLSLFDGLAGTEHGAILPAVRRLSQGGRALTHAARVGALHVGFWHARKPAHERRQ